MTGFTHGSTVHVVTLNNPGANTPHVYMIMFVLLRSINPFIFTHSIFLELKPAMTQPSETLHSQRKQMFLIIIHLPTAVSVKADVSRLCTCCRLNVFYHVGL